MVHSVGAAALLVAACVGGALVATDVAVASTTTGSQELSTKLNWGSCSIPSTAVTTGGFQCTTVTLPMCYEGDGLSCGEGSSRTHSLQMLRRGSDGSSTKPAVWVVTDSSSARETAQLMYEVSQNDTMQVFGLQLRLWNHPMGTEDTSADSRTPCSDLYAAYRARLQVNSSTVEAARNCSSWLTENFGTNGINAFSLDTAAKDLTRVMSLLQTLEPSTTKSGVYVLSSGRASRVVQRFMAQNENSKDAPTVSGYVFDTPHAMKLPATQDKVVGAVMDRFVASCALDEVCKSKFANISTTMSDVLKATYSALDQSSVLTSACLISLKDNAYDATRDLKPSHGVKRLLASLHNQMTPGLKLLAPLLYRLHRCVGEDTTVLKTLFEEMKAGAGKGPSPMVQFVDRTITFSEFWPSPPPSREQLTETFESTLVSDGAMALQQISYYVHTGGSPDGCSSLYKQASDIDSKVVLTYKPAATTSKSVDGTSGLVGSSTADVLILTSRMSITGSSDVSEQLYESFGSSVGQRVLIQSDNVAGKYAFSERVVGMELTGSDRETLKRVVGLFVNKKAKTLNGKWYVKDVEPFALSGESGSLKSTYGTAPLAVNFNPPIDEVDGWSSFRRQKDLYEEGNRPGLACISCKKVSCSNMNTDNVIKAGLAGVAVAFIIGGSSLIICICLGCFLGRRFMARRRDVVSTPQAPHDPSHGFPVYPQGPGAYQQQQPYPPQYFQQPHDLYQQQYHQPMPGQQNWNSGAPVVRSGPYGVI